FRDTLFAPAVAAHGLVNNPSGATPGAQILENIPLRDQPALVNTVPGAMALQQLIDRSHWAAQVGDPVTYPPPARKAPLAGVPPRRGIIQSGKGDRIVPTPPQPALARAGAPAARPTFSRPALFSPPQPRPLPAAIAPPIYPHTFLNTFSPAGAAAVSLAAQ